MLFSELFQKKKLISREKNKKFFINPVNKFK